MSNIIKVWGDTSEASSIENIVKFYAGDSIRSDQINAALRNASISGYVLVKGVFNYDLDTTRDVAASIPLVNNAVQNYLQNYLLNTFKIKDYINKDGNMNYATESTSGVVKLGYESVGRQLALSKDSNNKFYVGDNNTIPSLSTINMSNTTAQFTSNLVINTKSNLLAIYDIGLTGTFNYIMSGLPTTNPNLSTTYTIKFSFRLFSGMSEDKVILVGDFNNLSTAKDELLIRFTTENIKLSDTYVVRGKIDIYKITRALSGGQVALTTVSTVNITNTNATMYILGKI